MPQIGIPVVDTRRRLLNNEPVGCSRAPHLGRAVIAHPQSKLDERVSST